MKGIIISFISGIVLVLAGDGIAESLRQKEINALKVELRLQREQCLSEYKESQETYNRLSDLYYNLRKKVK